MTLSRRKQIIFEESKNVWKQIKGLKIFSTNTVKNGHKRKKIPPCSNTSQSGTVRSERW